MNRNNKKYFKNYNKLVFEDVMIDLRRKEILSFLKKNKSKKILEIGCGNRSISNYYRSYDRFVIVEPSEYFLKKNKFKKNNNKLKIYNCYLENFNNPENESFDFIICSSVLHEVSDPNKFLRQIHNISNKKTIVYLNVPNAHSLHRLIASEAGLIKSPFAKSITQKKMQQHRIYSLETLNKILNKSGFVIISKGTNFLKPFTHHQMQQIIKKKIISKQILIGMKKIVEFFPNYGAEINMYAKKK
jgi:SAM-dependent methyltransferase